MDSMDILLIYKEKANGQVLNKVWTVYGQILSVIMRILSVHY